MLRTAANRAGGALCTASRVGWESGVSSTRRIGAVWARATPAADDMIAARFSTTATSSAAANPTSQPTIVVENGYYGKTFTRKDGADSTAAPLPHTVVTYRNSVKDGIEGFLPHAIYDRAALEDVQPTHTPPETMGDKIAFGLMNFARSTFDTVTGYGVDMNEKKYLTRIIFLETVAGVPGMVGGMIRHLRSLRAGARDHGWIHTLLDEAENERMHLMWAVQLAQPSAFMRFFILMGQGVAVNAYFISYLLAPSTCHRFVGYLEEEAVKTYSGVVEAIDNGSLPEWKDKPASKLAKKYWHLPEDATIRDVILAIRADEAVHRQVNHTFAEIPPTAPNPFTL